MAAQQKNAYYRIYNQTTQEWDYYFFKTTAEQVITNGNYAFIKPNGGTTINGQNFTVNANNGNATASVTIDASHINWYNGSTKPTTNYLGDSSITNIQQALVQLDTKVKDAYDNIPAGILTTSNYANTLGSVYQAKDADLTAIAGLTGASGLLKKTAANTWALDTTAYVPESRTINSKQLNSNVILYASDIKISDVNNDSVSDYLSSIKSTAEGKSKSLVISYATTGTTPDGGHIVNSRFNSQDADITFDVDIELGGIENDNGAVLIPAGTDPNNYDVADIPVGLFTYWKVGDVILVKETDVPDRWVSNINVLYDDNNQPQVQQITFSKLETTKVDLTWSAISGKPTTLAGYGITDADTSINNSTGAITIKGITKTPIYDTSDKAPNNHAVNANTYGLGNSTVYGHVKLVGGDLNGKTSADGMAASQAHTHSQYLTSHQSLAGYATETWVDTNFIRLTVASSAPSNPSTGDVWINI